MRRVGSLASCASRISCASSPSRSRRSCSISRRDRTRRSKARRGRDRHRTDRAPGRGARASHHPLRRRLGRWHAAHRHAVHPDDRRLRQRRQHAARLPGRDPGARRQPARRVGLPAELLVVRHLHAGRRAGRARGDEPGGAQDEPHGRPAGRGDHRQQRCLHGAEPPEGGLRRQPADRRDAQGVHGLRGADQHAQRQLGRRPRADLQADRPDEELLHPRARVLAVRAEPRADAPLDRREVRRPTGHRRGQRPGPQGGLCVRRDDRDVPHPLPGEAGPPPAGHVSQHHRQRGDGARLPRRVQARRAATCSTAATRSRPRPTSSTSCRATRTSGSRPSRPRTRSRPSARPSGRATAAISG